MEFMGLQLPGGSFVNPGTDLRDRLTWSIRLFEAIYRLADLGFHAERLRLVAECFAAQGVGLAFETGQEDAETLHAFLTELDHPQVGVNFDPDKLLARFENGDPLEELLKQGAA